MAPHANANKTVPVYDTYAARALPDGAYPRLLNRMTKPEWQKSFLGSGAIRYKQHFDAEHVPLQNATDWDKWVLVWKDPAYGSGLMETILFGQLLPKAFGTRAGAKGNHFPQFDSSTGIMEKIDDDTRVKPIYMFGEPIRPPHTHLKAT
ncbi:hypothetical protein FA13DRAFT_1789113 [Coprinellus micaceus]|uniref:Uncharacterized protein n=1 Tax=Coprinellus micaceus TaxID=71717 RepID=A0A4Y7TKJ2_COPMI|nr:hypothetical protein FA13DRAFT_1789113 [Coprinellus micaceus]